MSASANFKTDTLSIEDHEAAARLIHQSLVHWYESKLNQGARFGDRHEPFMLFPEVYAALDPGEALAARDLSNGELLGVCFVHPRDTHIAVGIVATSPNAAGRGIARTMMELVAERARIANLPLRLVSSLMSLDSFSLYNRIGFVPHIIYQDMLLAVPDQGMTTPAPNGIERVRLARSDEAARIADFEFSLQGIRREKDFAFFLSNKVGDWKVWVSEDAQENINGVLVASHHPSYGMIGPGIVRDEASSTALLWQALHARRGTTAVFLVPSTASTLIKTLYSWGARNVELHVAQIIGKIPKTQGLTFPTFLPESA